MDWLEERNQWGGIRRYRWVYIGPHKVKEYEGQIQTTRYGQVAESDLVRKETDNEKQVDEDHKLHAIYSIAENQLRRLDRIEDRLIELRQLLKAE